MCFMSTMEYILILKLFTALLLNVKCSCLFVRTLFLSLLTLLCMYLLSGYLLELCFCPFFFSLYVFVKLFVRISNCNIFQVLHTSRLTYCVCMCQILNYFSPHQYVLSNDVLKHSIWFIKPLTKFVCQ